MTRQQLLERIQGLPIEFRELALSYAMAAYGAGLEGARGLARDPARRRALAGDPWRYFADVLKWSSLTAQQSEILEVLERHDRLLVAAASNIGKTFLIAGWVLYRFDAVAALPDAEEGLEEQGARVLLLGPDAKSVRTTVYAEMLRHARRAEAHGNMMPGYRSDGSATEGGRSELSVNWFVRPLWDVMALTPPKKVGEQVAVGAVGRHHRNLTAVLEEAVGMTEAVIAGAENMASGEGNKVVGIFQPYLEAGPVYERARRPGYRVLYASALDHPNVRHRRLHIPAAVSFRKVDGRVRDECRDLGSYPQAQPDPSRNDFVYALPPDGAAETGRPRKDGQPGHPAGRPRVYRPSALFEAQVLGRWPTSLGGGLFDAAAWERAVQRWEASEDPEGPPDSVGLDPAREGGNESVAVPRWGEGAEALLRAWLSARADGPAAVARLLSDRRARVGRPVVLPAGKGPEVAEEAVERFPRSPFVVDEGGVGASVLDHMTAVIQADVQGVSFGEAPPEPVEGEPWSENLRTAMAVRAAMLVGLGLADVPPDPLLREEVMAYTLKHRFRSVDVVDEHGAGRRARKPSVLLLEKVEVRRKIGRSPDRGDAFFLSLLEREGPREVGSVWSGSTRTDLWR